MPPEAEEYEPVTVRAPGESPGSTLPLLVTVAATVPVPLIVPVFVSAPTAPKVLELSTVRRPAFENVPGTVSVLPPLIVSEPAAAFVAKLAKAFWPAMP